MPKEIESKAYNKENFNLIHQLSVLERQNNECKVGDASTAERQMLMFEENIAGKMAKLDRPQRLKHGIDTLPPEDAPC